MHLIIAGLVSSICKDVSPPTPVSKTGPFELNYCYFYTKCKKKGRNLLILNTIFSNFAAETKVYSRLADLDSKFINKYQVHDYV